jgi:hypothetical protein
MLLLLLSLLLLLLPPLLLLLQELLSGDATHGMLVDVGMPVIHRGEAAAAAAVMQEDCHCCWLRGG